MHTRGSIPSVLLLEGGTVAERERAARFWTRLLNCRGDDPGCGACPACEQIEAGVFQDMLFFSGGEESIKIDQVRDLRDLLGQRPHGDGRRVIVFSEAQQMTREAANAMLKSLEETADYNAFVLLAPQREALLPTLVSRSWALNLGTTDDQETGVDDTAIGAADEALRYVATGRGWFAGALSGRRLDVREGAAVLRALRGRLILAFQGDVGGDVFAGLGPERLSRLIAVFDLAEEGLRAGVNPSLAADWVVIAARGIAGQDAGRA